MIKYLFVACMACISVAASASKLYYAGFSYLGQAELIDKNFPYTKQLDVFDQSVSRFDSELREKLKGIDLADTGVLIGELASLKDEEALGLTLALESEMVSVEKLSGQYKLLVQLAAQIMIFDYREMKIVATYPIDIQFNDSFDSQPSEADIKERIENLYFSDSNINILNIFIDRLKSIDPKRRYANYLKVVNVTLSENIPDVLGGSVSPRQLQQSIGQNFTRYLSTNQNISVLPYTKGHAIGNKLAVQYASGDAYMMEIPEPDYAVDIELTGLKKKLYSENVAGKAFIYATQARFKFYEPLTEEIYYEGKLYNGATKKVPASQESVNDWPSYSDTLLSLFDKVTSMLDKPDKGWFKKHSGKAKNYKDFKSIKKVIERCR
jgi:hypothetical protein